MVDAAVREQGYTVGAFVDHALRKTREIRFDSAIHRAIAAKFPPPSLTPDFSLCCCCRLCPLAERGNSERLSVDVAHAVCVCVCVW